MVVGLTTPAVVINNIGVAYVPNSVVTNDGLGEDTVRAQISGAGRVETVFTKDPSTKKSRVTFQMYVVDVNEAQLKNWKLGNPFNAIRVTADNGFTKAFNNMSMTSSPDIPYSTDGVIDITFEGDPVVTV